MVKTSDALKYIRIDLCGVVGAINMMKQLFILNCCEIFRQTMVGHDICAVVCKEQRKLEITSI